MLKLPPSLSSPPPPPGWPQEAELLIQLYDAHGLDMLGRLDGAFAFCLYDSKQARVLAARGSCGGVPLVEGRTATGSLIIACGTFMPEGVEDVKEIGAGEAGPVVQVCVNAVVGWGGHGRNGGWLCGGGAGVCPVQEACGALAMPAWLPVAACYAEFNAVGLPLNLRVVGCRTALQASTSTGGTRCRATTRRACRASRRPAPRWTTAYGGAASTCTG